MKSYCNSIVVGIVLAGSCLSLRAQTNLNEAVYSLDQFGPITAPVDAEATFRKAAGDIMAAGGGVIVIPVTAAKGWTPQNNTQTELRDPPPPAPAKHWGATTGVTVVDVRGTSPKIYPPQTTGMKIDRTLNLPQGESLPFWDYFPMVSLKNTILQGSTSYRDWLQEDVKAGKDRRFYVATIRGIFPGMFMSIGEWGIVQRLYVKSLGYDKEKQKWYFVADTEADQPKGAIMGNKNHVSIFNLETYSHNENQTFDVRMWRHNYSQGDNYLFDARFKYMGDVHSTAGDENGVLYAAFIESETDIFRGQVEKWNPDTGELVYKGSTGSTLGTGRPMINLNPAKWITNGWVCIVRPSEIIHGWNHDLATQTNYTGLPNHMVGGQIHFPAEVPLGDEVVGRYFAVDERDEYVPKGSNVRRWYLIDSVRKYADGSTDIEIVRHHWGAKAAGSPLLYKPENYSTDTHEKRMRYIIAPGANVYDVSQGVNNPNRTVKLVPTSFTKMPADFAPGDSLEQAIGPDPFKPIPFRSWMWDQVPGVFPAPVFDIGNMGSVMRDSVLLVHGNPSISIEKDNAERYDRNPPWNKYLEFDANCNFGIRFAADTSYAAIQFLQPHNRPQPIKWRYGGNQEAALTVAPDSGELQFTGGARLDGSMSVKGLSGDTKAAHNLRGKHVSVKAGETSVSVTFPVPEADDDYAVFIEQNWIGNRAVVKRDANGFVVQFEKPAPEGALIDWMIVR